MGKLALLLVIPLALSAQAPRRGGFGGGGFGFQWWDNPVASGLNLTDAQNQQIRSVVREYRSKLIDLRAAEEKAQGELQDVFNDAPGDTRRANEVIDRLANARAEATKTISQMSLRMRNILTAEQYQELRQRMDDRRNRIPSVDLKNGPPSDRRRRSDSLPGGPPQANAGTPPPGAPAPSKPTQK
jgi:Spy/CpxP family protein refolding chaperone